MRVVLRSARSASPPRPLPPGSAFTIIELLVTLAIVAVLMTISLGALARISKKDALEATTQGVRALLRRARNSAQEERMATVVEVDVERSALRAQTKTTITQFRFEVGGAPSSDAGDDGTTTAPTAPPPPITREPKLAPPFE